MAARRRLTRAERLEIMARQGFLCGCGCHGPVWPGGPVEWDHVLPLELSGADSLSNLQALIPSCHRKHKTPADQKRIAKAKRQARETGPQRLGRKVAKIQGRGFPGSRRFDGTIRWKETGDMERDRQVTTPELPAEVLEILARVTGGEKSAQVIAIALKAAGYEVRRCDEWHTSKIRGRGFRGSRTSRDR